MKSSAEIADLCRRLAGVLETPEPGLMTWQEARVELGRELRDALDEVLPFKVG